ncbi:MAG: NAD(P)-dependent oxidoreductase [Anaerolineales bacterium]|nr:NAD(P)-dependent oxidoreductase [Anaerolineales bacterium]
MKIGFIGLGIMGSRMAANLQKNGHELVVHNRTRAKADELVAKGAVWADSAAAVAQQVETLLTMLSAPDAVAEAALGQAGFLAHLKPGSLWIDCSTVTPSFSRDMAAKAREKGIRFLDAPVAGSKEPAEKGQLLFLVGGDKADVEAGRPLFEVMGRGVTHVGEQGMGISLKIVLNLMLAQAMITFSEAITLGQSLGLSQPMLLETLLGSAVAAPFLAGKRSKIEQDTYEADFPLQWMYKDLQMAATTAYEQGVALPQGNAAKELYALATRQGLGQADFSAIYRFLNQQTAK